MLGSGGEFFTEWTLGLERMSRVGKWTRVIVWVDGWMDRVFKVGFIFRLLCLIPSRIILGH